MFKLLMIFYVSLFEASQNLSVLTNTGTGVKKKGTDPVYRIFIKCHAIKIRKTMP